MIKRKLNHKYARHKTGLRRRRLKGGKTANNSRGKTGRKRTERIQQGGKGEDQDTSRGGRLHTPNDEENYHKGGGLAGYGSTRAKKGKT